MNFTKKVGCLAVSAVVVLALAYLYTVRVNPEVAFWRAVSKKQAEWAEQSTGARYVFTGGSSCVFSINPALIEEEFGITVINAAAGAGLGRPFHLDSADRFLREGDTLVLNFETDWWQMKGGLGSPPLGTSAWFSYLREQHEGKPLSMQVREKAAYKLRDVRSGGEHFILMGTKFLMGKKFYRYTVEDIHDGGYCTTDAEMEFSGGLKLTPSHIYPQNKQFLKELKEVLAARGVSLMVNNPWKFTAEEVVEQERAQIKKLMTEVSEICPVIPDPYFGCRTKREVFADTGWHLSEEFATERSIIVGEFLKNTVKN